jgi:hypothetical protein
MEQESAEVFIHLENGNVFLPLQESAQVAQKNRKLQVHLRIHHLID